VTGNGSTTESRRCHLRLKDALGLLFRRAPSPGSDRAKRHSTFSANSARWVFSLLAYLPAEIQAPIFATIPISPGEA
jgi:hypothetical protein